MRETSIEAYNKIKANGLLRHRKWEVYDSIFKYGPLSINETWLRLKEIHPGIAQDGVHQRFSELNSVGVIQQTGKRPCAVTGMTVYVWEVTGRLPSVIEKKKTSQQIIEELMKENEFLKKRILELESLVPYSARSTEQMELI